MPTPKLRFGEEIPLRLDISYITTVYHLLVKLSVLYILYIIVILCSIQYNVIFVVFTTLVVLKSKNETLK